MTKEEHQSLRDWLQEIITVTGLDSLGWTVDVLHQSIKNRMDEMEFDRYCEEVRKILLGRICLKTAFDQVEDEVAKVTDRLEGDAREKQRLSAMRTELVGEMAPTSDNEGADWLNPCQWECAWNLFREERDVDRKLAVLGVLVGGIKSQERGLRNLGWSVGDYLQDQKDAICSDDDCREEERKEAVYRTD